MRYFLVVILLYPVCLPGPVLAADGETVAVVAENLEQLDKLQKKEPKQALLGKLKIYRGLGDNQMIVAVANQLLELEPENFSFRLEKALALFQLGTWETVEGLLVGVTVEKISDVTHLIGLGRFYLWKGEFESARLAFEKALGLDTGSWEARLGLAWYHVWLQEDAEARKIVGEILIAQADNVDALILLGWLTTWSEEFDLSIATFSRALELAPQHPEALRGLGQAHHWAGHYTDSLKAFDELLVLQPDRLEILLSRARLQREFGHYESALASLNQALTLDAERVDIKEELEITRQWMSDIDNRLRTLQREIQLNSGDVASYVALGQNLAWVGQVKEAQETYTKALQADPENVDLLLGLATANENLGHVLAARQQYQKVLQLKGTTMEAKRGLKRIHDLFSPVLNLQYSFTWNRPYDHSISAPFSKISTHTAQTEISKRLNDFYTLRAAYLFSTQEDYDPNFVVVNHQYLQHQFYLHNEFDLPYDFSAQLRYAFNAFNNQGNNFFNLPGTSYKHGGFILVGKPYAFNYFGLQLTRDFFPVDVVDLAFYRQMGISLSDDISVGEHISGLLSLAFNHNTFSEAWSRTYTIHPRYNLPFFDNLFVEYEWNLTEPDPVHEHRGILRAIVPLSYQFQAEFSYALNYLSPVDEIGHQLDAFLSFSPTERIGTSASVSFNYFNKDIIQNYLLSLSLQL